MPSTRGAGRDDKKKRLQFRDKLVGKGLATDALLKKLKTLHQELEKFEQEAVHTPSLESVRKELLHSTLLLHKDRGVKAYVACCHADLLRLYAPECEYTGPELQDVFDFMFRQLGVGLTAQDAPYYAQYYHLLESLSSVKSVVLICDLPGADKLMKGVFKEFFAIVKRDLPKKIELFCADILAALIEESKSIPSDILERYLLQQFKDDHAVCLFISISNTRVDIAAENGPSDIQTRRLSLSRHSRYSPATRLPILHRHPSGALRP
jgi:sister-chromatid-cohesion protein PDS5